MINEPCITQCDFITQNKSSTKYICSLYDIVLNTSLVEDKYDEGYIKSCLKCTDCQEKELSNSIDNKIDEIKDLYNVFVYEMDLLMSELSKLKVIRRSIYE